MPRFFALEETVLIPVVVLQNRLGLNSRESGYPNFFVVGILSDLVALNPLG